MTEQYRLRGEALFLHSQRSRYGGPQNSHQRLKDEVTGLLFDRANAKKWWGNIDAGSMSEVIQYGRKGEVLPQKDIQELPVPIPRPLADPHCSKHLCQEGTETKHRRFQVQVCEYRFHDRVLS